MLTPIIVSILITCYIGLLYWRINVLIKFGIPRFVSEILPVFCSEPLPRPYAVQNVGKFPWTSLLNLRLQSCLCRFNYDIVYMTRNEYMKIVFLSQTDWHFTA